MASVASLVLRIGLGVMFAAHGLQKVFGMFEGPGIGGFSKMLSGLGFVPPVFWAYVVAFVELIGGLCLILGIFTRIFSLLLCVVMVVAIAIVHLSNGFFMSAGGFEYQFIIICALITLLLLGPGKLALLKKF